MTKKLFGIPAYDGPTNPRIRRMVDHNPKRGDAAIRFAQYRTGTTVGEFILACEDLDVQNYAIFDITWDSDPKRRFIELYD
jgi:hypothetical protein